MKLSKGARGISAAGLCSAGHYAAVADLSNDHCVWVFEAGSGKQVFKQKGDQTNRLQDLAFSKKEGSTKFATVGKRHIYFWDAKDGSGEKKKGIFNGHKMTSFTSCTWDQEDVCYTSGSNGSIYKWNTETRCCEGTMPAHKGGISAIQYCEGHLWSAGKDCKLHQINPADMTIVQSWDTESVVRSIDVRDGKRLVGMRCGTIKCDDQVLMRSHSDGEVWGLCYVDGMGPITSGDDNKVICWSDADRNASKYCDKVTDRATSCKAGGASTLADTPDSQQFRAVACHGDHIAIGDNAGGVTIRKTADPSSADGEQYIADSGEWIEAMAFSPDGKYLAVGSHDNAIRVYDASEGFSLVGTCTGHSSFITALDWSQDGTVIRTNSGDYELLFWNVPSCEQDKDGMSNNTGTEWATTSMKVSWETRNIYPSGVDGTHINGVARSPDGTLIATGDDYGLVSIFNNPVRPGVIPRCFRGHSEHVTRVAFNTDGSKLFSIGGYDQTLMQFQK